MKILYVLGVLFLSTQLFAWTPSGETVTIEQMIKWNNNSTSTVFKTSGNYRCYIPSEEEGMYSLILSLFVSGKSASIHCHDKEETIGGIKAHRVHRVIANRK